MAVSQKQIAEKLGVSITLVSRVLSGKAAEIGIAEKTIHQVLAAAEELGYVPSTAALSLKGKSTRTIGVTVYDFNDPFFGALIKQIQIQAHEHNYSLVLAGFLNRIPTEQDLQPLRKHTLDGLVVLGSDTKSDWLHSFRHLPVARIGHGSPEENSLRITVDEDDAAKKLVHHLYGSGRRNILCISGMRHVHHLRQIALEKASATAGIQLTCINSRESDPFAIGQQVTQHLLATASLNANALVCVTDQIAMGALHALNNANISVPEQIAVTGFDDIPFAVQFIPPITTIRQPVAEMVQIAVQSVVEKRDPADVFIQAELIIRKSTRL